MKFVKLNSLVVVMLILGSPALADVGELSADGLWREIDPVPVVDRLEEGAVGEKRLRRAFRLDMEAVRSILEQAPMEFEKRGVRPDTTISLPMPDGSFPRYRVEESPTCDPEDAPRHPILRTYRVRGVDNPTDTGRISLTPSNLRGLILTERGMVRIRRHGDNPKKGHLSYILDGRGAPMACGVGQPADTSPRGPKSNLDDIGDTGRSSTLDLPGDCVQESDFPPPAETAIRTYKIALASRVDYSSLVGVDNQVVLAHLCEKVTDLNAIFEREFSINFDMLWDERLVYRDADPVDGACDPDPVAGYSCPTETNCQKAGCVLQELNQMPDGIDDFDIGHTLGRHGDCQYYGRADVFSICSLQPKDRADALTNRLSYDDDGEHLLRIAHEIGHQLGAVHVMSTDLGICNAEEWSAYEPGSGSTIMSYAGHCGGHNVQEHQDNYFNIDSIEWVQQTLHNSIRNAQCIDPEWPSPNNDVPVVGQGGYFTLPPRTPFVLSGSAIDPDGDAVTYTWEQRDHDCKSTSPYLDDPGPDPIFRSFPPESAGVDGIFSREFLGKNIPGEILPVLNTLDPGGDMVDGEEPLTMRLVARDNNGGVAYEETEIDIVGDRFQVVVEPVRENYPTHISWNYFDEPVYGTASKVDIWVSIDGEKPELVASYPENVGSADVDLGLDCEMTNVIVRVEITQVEPTEQETSLTFFTETDVEVYCDCPSENDCGECYESNFGRFCSRTDTGLGRCWRGDDLFICDDDEVIGVPPTNVYTKNCRCVYYGVPRPLCLGESQSLVCGP